MWINDISSIVYSRIKIHVRSKLKSKYPELFFTNSSETPSDPKFPTVYIHELSGSERGQDLENDSINSVISSFQIEVSDNVNQSRAKEVMNEVVKIMKQMRYSVSDLPEFQNVDGYFRSVARFRRTIGKNDIL